MPWPGIDAVRRRILRERRSQNRNNLTRSDYYLAFWRDHPEIPWALMANLVSRNAGYQMSDLERYYQLAPVLVLTVRIDPRLALSAPALQALCVTTFAYLETGNFLILRDVLPVLETYRFARQFPEHRSELLGMLRERAFDADPFVVDELERFIDQASQASWFANWRDDPAQLAAIRRFTFALVSNEQNQIEDRLVNPGIGSRYFGPFGYGINAVIRGMAALGLTRLVFPLGAAGGAELQLLIYEVSDFVNLGGRIDTGRDLFVHLFERGAERYQRAVAWARRRPTHTASRSDYNPTNFTPNKSALVRRGRIYFSPWLVPAWPATCSGTFLYGHLHQTPLALPKTVRERPGHGAWLEPRTTPSPVMLLPPGDVAEIPDALLTRTLEVSEDWVRHVLP